MPSDTKIHTLMTEHSYCQICVTCQSNSISHALHLTE